MREMAGSTITMLSFLRVGSAMGFMYSILAMSWNEESIKE